MMNECKRRVVIIGHGYTSRLGIIRSLAELDCDITVVAVTPHNRLGRFIRLDFGKPIDCYSKYVNRVLYCKPKEKDLVEILLSRCVDKRSKTIIIPDSDFSAAVVDRNQERFKEHFIFPTIHSKPGAVEYWMKKDRQKQAAAEMGINVAGDCTVVVNDGSYSMPENIHYPCFIKPLASINGGKRFVRRCDTQEDLRAILDKLSQSFSNVEVLVEDFKSIDTEYAVVGYSDGIQVVIPGVIEFLANSKSHFGIALEGKIIPVSGFESLLERFKALICHIGFTGLFDIDFYKSEGKLYFSEINFRFGGSGYAYTAMGANLPASMLMSFFGNDYKEFIHNISNTATFANERMCMDDFYRGYITEKDVYDILNKVDIRFIDNDDDPRPSKKLKREFKLLRIKRLLSSVNN